MNALHYGLFAVGLLLEFVLLWRIQRERMWRRYPFFAIYVCYVACRTVILFLLFHLHEATYAAAYWTSELVALALWFFITWEVFRRAFPHALGIRRMVGVVLLIVCLLVLCLAGYARGDKTARVSSVLSDLERYASLFQTIVLLLILSAAQYYRVRLGRNIWGTAVGFGIFVSFSAANFSAFQLWLFFLPFWQLLRPLSFVIMLAIWTWALWRYAPNPPVPEQLRGRDLRLVLWHRDWARLLSTLRKAFER
jgi:hypothetical protein